MAEITIEPTAALSGEELLTTTRCVRRRLDLTRPVAREQVEHCVETALQAPTGSYSQIARFICVTDPERRAALGEIYRKGWGVYTQTPLYAGGLPIEDPRLKSMIARGLRSAEYLVEHMHEAPVLVIPCADLSEGLGPAFVAAGYRRELVQPAVLQAAMWGSVMPAAWSFMLAARAMALSSCWTVVHMFFEQEAAEVLGIPFESVIQAAMIPVGHTLGEGFHPGPRMPVGEAVHWDRW
jgi:nitroreductase